MNGIPFVDNNDLQRLANIKAAVAAALSRKCGAGIKKGG
jgi:hypothetical protein